MKEYILLDIIARRAIEADYELDLIANEKPFEPTSYNQCEAKRNTLCDVCGSIERVFKMDGGQAELALKHARIAIREERERINNHALDPQTVEGQLAKVTTDELTGSD